MLFLGLLAIFALFGFAAGQIGRRHRRAWAPTLVSLLLAVGCLAMCPVFASDGFGASREIGRVFLGASYFFGVACSASISSNFTNAVPMAAVQATLLSIGATVLLFMLLGPLGCGWFGDCL